MFERYPFVNDFAVWLQDLPTWLQKWQTLVAAIVASTVASTAAYIAFQNTTRSLRHAEHLETHRRTRKHAAVRAVLPLALAQVMDYAAKSAYALSELVRQCSNETLPVGTAPASLIEPLPSETLKALADFIEYSDTVETRVMELTIVSIQIHNSRLRDVAERNHDSSGTQLVIRSNLEQYIIDAASIYAGAGAALDYARQRQTELPRALSWDAVENALNNIRFWSDKHPRLHDLLTRLKGLSAGPFEKLNVPQ